MYVLFEIYSKTLDASYLISSGAPRRSSTLLLSPLPELFYIINKINSKIE